MVIANIVENISLGSVTSNTTGSIVDTKFLARKSVFVNVLAGSNATVNVEASNNNVTSSQWYELDSKTYASGTSTQLDIFSYNSHFPYMRTTLTNASGTTVSTTITGRGV